MTRVVAIAGAATAFVVLFAGTALAHPRLTSSDPSAGSTVTAPPSEIYTEFSEAITAGSYIEVTDPCGRSVNSGATQVSTTSMTQAISAEAAGRYTVFWQANGADGHPVQGDFTFTSSGGAPCPGEEPEEEEPKSGGGNAPKSSGGGTEPGSTGSGSDPSTAETTEDTTGSAGGSRDGRQGDSGGKHGRHGDAKKNRGGGEGGSETTTGPFAGARSDVPDAPSALEGIPVDGLVITLVVAALIGAAAGKIYVSLSGDNS